MIGRPPQAIATTVGELVSGRQVTGLGKFKDSLGAETTGRAHRLQTLSAGGTFISPPLNDLIYLSLIHAYGAALAPL